MKTEIDQTGIKRCRTKQQCPFPLAEITFRNFAYASHCQAYTN
jgi:hypothetical protein